MPRNLVVDSESGLPIPEAPPDDVITDIYGGDEGEQAALDIWKEQHNKQVEKRQGD